MPLRLNANLDGLRCSSSGQRLPRSSFASPVGLCSCCPPPGKPLLVEYDHVSVKRELHGAPWSSRNGPGIWRYSPLLPVVDVAEEYAAGVGLTPVVAHRRLGDRLGVEVFLKNEGGNPSGSFKDRGLAVAVALGAACGARRFCLPTQGNAGVAACLFSTRLALPACLVYMPEPFRGSIYHRSCEFFGGEVRFAGRDIAAAGRQMRDDLGANLASGEFVDISTFFEPGRLEGKKTMGLEIAERFEARALPDFIVYPTGGGTGLVGIWKAFTELAALGLPDAPARDRLPRMVAVQSARCAPLVDAFQKGLDEVVPVRSQGTVADGLDVPSAIMGHGMLRVLRESRGGAVAVSDESIVAAFKTYGELGINAGYEAAATLAGVAELRASGFIPGGATVLLLNTGTHMTALARANDA
jgi:threonine synthase